MPRRRFLRPMAFGSALVAVPGRLAEELALTPRQTEGPFDPEVLPFDPDVLPLDTDNDVVVVNERLTPAVGEVAWLSGRWLTEAGSPIRHATIAIWPGDSTGAISIRRPAPTRRSGTRMVTALAGPWFFAPPRGGSAGFLQAGRRERTPRGRRGSVDGGAGWTGGQVPDLRLEQRASRPCTRRRVGSS